MARRSADLAKIPTRTPEQVRVYGRAADELLGDLATEFEMRRKELAKRIFALLKEAHKQGLGTGEDKYLRALQATRGLITAAVAVRVARHGVRILYPALEKHAGTEIDRLREKKYGKTEGHWKPQPDERMDV